MSLLNDSMTDCVVLQRSVEPDGHGGYNSVFSVGTQFKASIVYGSSSEAVLGGEAKRITNTFLVTTPRAVVLAYHDVVKRLSDGKLFRIITDPTENKTPASAGLDMRQASAEEWTAT